MTTINHALELIRKGNTLDGHKQLAGLGLDAPDALAALNAALFTTTPEGDGGAVQVEIMRLLELLKQSEGEGRKVILYNLGCLALHQEDVITAKMRFAEAIKIDPAMVAAQHNLGYADELLTNLEEAKATYRKVLDLEPANHLTRVNLANVLEIEGKRGEGLETLREALATDESSPGIAYYLCSMLLTSGDEAEAAEALVVLEKITGGMDFVELRECRAMAFYLVGDYEQAGNEFRALLAGDENRIFARLGLIKTLAAMGGFDEILPEAEILEKLSPSEELQALIRELKK